MLTTIGIIFDKYNKTLIKDVLDAKVFGSKAPNEQIRAGKV
jgi:hypothetical protein